jgi:hypothetical protein
LILLVEHKKVVGTVDDLSLQQHHYSFEFRLLICFALAPLLLARKRKDSSKDIVVVVE